MQNKSLVSVLTVTYNHEKYIDDCIKSILASTYTNFELIVVDDVSPDRTYEIAKKYEEIDNRVKVYRNEKNLGDYPNRNKAASYAKGKYLKYVDGDDLIYPNGLEIMIRAMQQNPEAAIGLSHPKPEEAYPYPYQVLPEEAYKEHFLGRGLFNSGPTGFIIKHDVFINEKGFSEVKYSGDTEFLLRIGAKYPTVKISPGLIWWRQHESQESKEEQKMQNSSLSRFNLNIKYLTHKNCPLSEQQKQLAINRLRQYFSRNLLSLLLKQGKINLFWLIFKKSNLSFFDLLKGLKKYQ